MPLDRALLTDLGLLVGRLGIGVILFAYGWQKLTDWTVEGTAEIMSGGGVPLPTLSAYFTTWVELLGGAALVLGAAVRLAALAGAFVMAGAFVYVHGGNGIYVDGDGYGFVLAIGVTCLLLAATGAGRLSVDHLLAGRLPSPMGRSGARARAGAGSAR
ncbi:DoxX family protein [Streptomyces triticirhizae]|uniref:DoxX family protein n=1 Tax=Streptomyces triticirhizae TaxID=2483353 RepID=A0A3M2LTC7_9ACTN|nr:DoxX family protein [Streptomyces triticirhizae]RMI38128.1 DoxX family protein [Streptomyces triticirhizae]